MNKSPAFSSVAFVFLFLIVGFVAWKPAADYYKKSLGIASRPTSDLSCVKLQTMALLLYCNDYDDIYPMASGTSSSGAYLTNDFVFVPATWPDRSNPNIREREEASQFSWPNSIVPYLKDLSTLGGVLQAQPNPILDALPVRRGQRPVGALYTFNGLLTTSSMDKVKEPAKLIAIWPGQGRRSTLGGALSSPKLICPRPYPQECLYVPSSSSCTSAKNGQTSRFFQIDAPMKIANKGMNVGHVDGSSKNVALHLTSPTDWKVDPFSDYESDFTPLHPWWDGCHAWLFRPDYDFK